MVSKFYHGGFCHVAIRIFNGNFCFWFFAKKFMPSKTNIPIANFIQSIKG